MQWRSLARRPAALATGGVLVALAVSAVAAPLLAPADPIALDLAQRLIPPSFAHPLGTDEMGRDILSRILYGGRMSLSVGFAAAAVSAAVGVPLGLLAAYFPGRMSDALMRAVDFLLALPAIILALLFVAALGPGPTTLIVAISIVSAPVFVRLARAETLAIKKRAYVEATTAVGASHAYVMFKVILPNATASLIPLFTLTVASAVLLEGGLSFLGLGVPPPTPTWGLMLSNGRAFIAESPLYTIAPGVALTATVLALDMTARQVRRISGGQLESELR